MISKIIAEDLIDEGKQLIFDSENIVILAHQGPDGDAIGSSLAMYHFLLEIGKSSFVILPDAIPENLALLPGAENIVIYEQKPSFAQSLINKTDLIICLDFNETKRLGDELGNIIKDSSASKLMLDHHLNPANEFDVMISYPSISSNAEIIFRFICRMGFFEELNTECATCIFTGMMTDTGFFSYNSSDPEFFIIISELLKKGINKDAIYNHILNTNSETQIRLKGYVLHQKIKFYPEYHSAIITLSKDEMLQFNVKKGDTEGFVNIPLSVKGIYFSIFLKEDDNKIKVSLRSKGSFAVNEVSAKKFSGGGHLNAAGGELKKMSMDEAVKYAEDVIQEYQQELTEN